MLRALQGMGRGAQGGEGAEAGSGVWGVHGAVHGSPEGMGPLTIKSHIHSVNLPLRQEPVFTADEGCKMRRGEYVSLFAPWLLLQQREVEGGSWVPPAPLAPTPPRGLLSNPPPGPSPAGSALRSMCPMCAWPVPRAAHGLPGRQTGSGKRCTSLLLDTRPAGADAVAEEEEGPLGVAGACGLGSWGQ